MGDKSAIEWTEATWNPTTGCDRDQPGVRPLLCTDVGQTAQVNGSAQVPARRGPSNLRTGVCSHPAPEDHLSCRRDRPLHGRSS